MKTTKHNKNHFKLHPLPTMIASFFLLGTSIATAHAEGELTLLGDLLGFGNGPYVSSATGVSADGNVVIGLSRNSTSFEAFRWTETNGMTGLGDLGDISSFTLNQPNGVNADGSVIVGSIVRSNALTQAYRWTQADGMVSLGTLIYTNTPEGSSSSISYFSEANDVSADGSVVVGGSLTPDGYKAFRWTQAGGMVSLGDLSGNSFYSNARAVSDDGSVVVGGSRSPNSYQAFRWTNAGGMVGLGALANSVFQSSEATDVNADGNVVVGYSHTDNGDEAFRWTQADGMVGLGTLADIYQTGAYAQSSRAHAVNADGSVVVGNSDNLTGNAAFRWTQATGMISVAGWLAASGVTLAENTFISAATGVSADGSVVVGTSFSRNGTEAYLARVSAIGSGVINPVTFNNNMLLGARRALQVGASLPNLVLFGAHHRTILDNGLVRSAENGACAWATGDIAQHNESDTDIGLAEVGVCKDFNNMRIGVGIGQDWAKQDWQLGGEAKYRGQHLLLEAANAFENGLQPSIIGYYGHFDTTMNRNYQNGSAINTSRGTPDASSKAVRLRLDWKNMVHFGSTNISPYIAYTWMRTHLNGYTESGGGFPVRYDSNSWTTNDIRLGAATNFAVGNKLNVRIGAEAAHRFEGNLTGTSGQVLGLNSFETDGVEVQQTWARVTADVDYRFSDEMLITLGTNLGSSGGDASWGLTAGLRANF